MSDKNHGLVVIVSPAPLASLGYRAKPAVPAGRQSLIRILLILTILSLSTGIAAAAEYKITQLTNNSYDNKNPQIDNGQVVWTGYDGHDYEVFLYDGTRTIQFTNNDYDDYAFQIDNGQVVWWGGNKSEIFLYNGTRTIQLTNNEYADYLSCIDNGQVGWCGFDGHDYEIFLYNGTRTIQLTNNNYDDFLPNIDNGQVVWYGFDGHDYEIFLYDGTRTIQFTNDDYRDGGPNIDNGQVVWSGYYGPYGGEIFLYDGTRTIRLTNNSYNDEYSQIDNGQVVWMGLDGHDYEIFLYDGTRTIQLTNNDYHDLHPQINNGQVVWYGYDGNDWEIFLATPEMDRIPLGRSKEVTAATSSAFYRVYVPDSYGGTLNVKSHYDADIDLYYPDTNTRLTNVEKSIIVEEVGGAPVQKLCVTYEIPFQDTGNSLTSNHGWYYAKLIKKPAGVSSFTIENTFIQKGEVPEERRPWNISTWWPFSDVNDDGVNTGQITNLYDDDGPLAKYDLAIRAGGGSSFAADWEKGRSLLDAKGTTGHYIYNGNARETHAEKDFKYDWDTDAVIETPGPYDFYNSTTKEFWGAGDGDLDDTYNTTWWGHCDGWALASIIFKDPTTLALKGSFNAEDVKGLLTEISMRSPNEPDIISTMDSDYYAHGVFYEGKWLIGLHDFLHQWLRKEGKAILGNLKNIYRKKNDVGEVWNHPIYYYSVQMRERAGGDEKTVDAILSLKAADDLGNNFREDSDRPAQDKALEGGYGAGAWRYHLKYNEKGEIVTAGSGWDTTATDDANTKYYIPYLVHPKSGQDMFYPHTGRANPFVNEDNIKTFVVDGEIRRETW